MQSSRVRGARDVLARRDILEPIENRLVFQLEDSVSVRLPAGTGTLNDNISATPSVKLTCERAVDFSPTLTLETYMSFYFTIKNPMHD